MHEGKQVVLSISEHGRFKAEYLHKLRPTRSPGLAGEFKLSYYYVCPFKFLPLSLRPSYYGVHIQIP